MEQFLTKLLLVLALLALERGPWLLIGRIPDRNPYSCSASTSGTYVGPSASITDSMCAVWTLGAGTTPFISILRNGSQVAGGQGVKIEYYMGVVYVLANDSVSWYSWSDDINDYQLFGTSDPSMSMVPTGYFVSTTGLDSRTCVQSQSASTPKLTFASAMTCLSPGDTLYARGGTYAEALQNNIPSGTSWASKIRIANYPGEVVWLHPTATNFAIRIDVDQQYIEFDGINADGSDLTGAVIWVAFFNPAPNQPHHIRFQNAEYKSTPSASGTTNIIEIAAKTPIVTGGIELRYLTLHGGGETGGTDFNTNGYGIYMAAPNNLIEFNNIYDNRGCEIQVFNDDGAQPDNNIIRNNILHDETRPGHGPVSCGIIVAGSNNQIYNNAIYGIAASTSSGDADAIAMYTGSGNKILNNTFYGNTGGLQIFSGASSTTAQNNISYGNLLFNYSNASGSTTHTSNLDDGTNPVFVNAASANFRLQISSPAKDAGTSLASFFTTDLESIPRPQGPLWDIGAYEYH